LADYIIHLTDEQDKALQVVCAELETETHPKPSPQEVIDEQCAYYIKRMLLRNVKIPIPDEALAGLKDIEQAELAAKVINYYPAFIEDMKLAEETLGLWDKIKAIITGG